MRRRIPIGRLDRRIKLQSVAVAAGTTYGDPVETWTDLATGVPAMREDMRAAEDFQSGQRFARQVSRFTVRWQLGFDVTDRIVDGSETFDILSVSPPTRKDYIVFDATARPAAT